jgi:hypothetical protein|tara:strand:+ start:1485 stop:1754 length:270 start_codon:yes stop_codon:yes gene_type:complete
MLGVCGALTAARLPAWRSDVTLWHAAVRVTPEATRPILNLSSAYLRVGACEEAAEWRNRAQRTLQQRPSERGQRVLEAQARYAQSFCLD